MWKLTNSFCRFLKLTCESLIKYRNKTYLKNKLSLAGILQTCNGVNCVSNVNLSTPFIDTGQQTQFYSNIKNKLYSKKTSKYSNVSRKFKQMSDSLQPTLNHVSYGGQFEISSENSSSGSDWKKALSNSSSESETNWRRSLSDTPTNSRDKKETCGVPPDFRAWEEVLKRNDVKDGSIFQFKILSYNVLAQYLLECHPYLYTDCHPYNLKWKVRAARLYDEIMKLSPDILCLQEVQASHVNTFYAKFEDVGYCGIFKQKTGQRQDGCAIYFKRSLFEMQDHNTVEYYQPELPILNRDNIGVMVKLMPKNYLGPPIVIATTHLLYNPKRTDVRLAQIQVLLAEIDRFAYFNNGRDSRVETMLLWSLYVCVVIGNFIQRSLNGSSCGDAVLVRSGHLPVILTGDLNSTPDSAVVKLLERGQVSASSFRDTSDWKKIGVTDNCQHLSVHLNRKHGIFTEFCMTKIYNSDYRESPLDPELDDPIPTEDDYSDLFNSGVISHSLNLMSTYTKYKSNGCFEATTYQDYWVTVDYIYFSYCSNLRLVERLRLPTAGECEVLGRLPNDAYGSDHLALAAVFELKPITSSL